MLFLTHTPGESLTLHPQPGLDPNTPVAMLFESGPIRVQVVGVRDQQVHLGVAAPAGLCILRDVLPLAGSKAPPESLRWVLAHKLKVLRFLRQHSPESLAAAARVPVGRVMGAERAKGALELDDLERLARALGVEVAELFQPAGRTAEERVLLAILEEES